MKTLSKISIILFSAAAVLSACGKEEGSELRNFFLTSPANGSLTITQNEDFRIKFGTVPEEAAGTVLVEWSIDDPDIATVRNGRVSPQKPGEAVITVKCGKFTETVNLTVKGIPVTSFSVPAELNAYYDNPKEIPLTVEPAEANAASLNWYVEDENVAFITFEDGKAYINATSEVEGGTTTVTVCADNLEPQTIEISARTRGVLVGYSYTDGTATYDLVDGKELDYNLLSFSEEDNAATLLYIAAIKISSLEVKVDNPKVCTVSKKLITEAFGTWYTILIGDGSEYGTTGVTITTQMDGLTFTNRFTVRREPLVFPEGVCIYNADKKCAMAAEEEVSRGQTINLMLTAGGQTSYPAKWTTNNTSLATVKTADGNTYSRKAIVTTTSSASGKVTITATDESGKNVKSVVLNVTKEHFSDNVYLMRSDTGEKIEKESLTVTEFGIKFMVKLSENYATTTWTSSSSDMAIWQDTNNPCERALEIRKPNQEYVLSIKDEMGNVLRYSFRADLSLKTVVAIPEDVNGLSVSHQYAVGGKKDWIYMPFLPESNSLHFKLVNKTLGTTVNDLASGGWSSELITSKDGNELSNDGSSRITLVTKSYKDKQILIKDKFGNEKIVVIRPSLDFRDKSTWSIKEETSTGSQNLPYNNDGTVPGDYTNSLNKVGGDWDDYHWYAVANSASYKIDMNSCFRGEAEKCDWKGWNDKTGKFVYCGPTSLPNISYMIKHITDQGLHIYGISDGGSSQYHDHHDTHRYRMQAREATGGSDAGQDAYFIYGHCGIFLRVKE
ncbi:MAG: hypothetical protein ACI3Y9_10070 [Candidatus Cryptobacteroides sp.]